MVVLLMLIPLLAPSETGPHGMAQIFKVSCNPGHIMCAASCAATQVTFSLWNALESSTMADPPLAPRTAYANCSVLF